MSAEKTYPDARLLHGEVVDYVTGDFLPNFEGLAYANLQGYGYILYTWLEGSDRRWDVVHSGGILQFTEIEKYLKKKGKSEASK